MTPRGQRQRDRAALLGTAGSNQQLLWLARASEPGSCTGPAVGGCVCLGEWCGDWRPTEHVVSWRHELKTDRDNSVVWKWGAG